MASSVATATSRPSRHVRWRRSLGHLLAFLGIASYAASVSYAQVPGNVVYVVPIHGEIDLGLAPYLSRVLEQARRDDARAVILEFDTPGGRLDAALQMRHAILDSPLRPT